MHRHDIVRREQPLRALSVVGLLLAAVLLISSGCAHATVGTPTDDEGQGGGPGGGSASSQGGSHAGGAGGQGGSSPLPTCGNGVVTSGEACDDGNPKSGDGCSAACAVEAGWTCRGASSQCADVDECAPGLNTCDPNATCINVPGSFGCTCKPGYTGNGLVCMNSDDCSPNPCQHGGTFTDGGNGYTCACASGYTGPTCALTGSATTGMAAGYGHSLALKSDGTVWAWGGNSSGQLGDGTTTERSTPGQVGNLAGVIAVAAAGTHSLALKSDGTVWAWKQRIRSAGRRDVHEPQHAGAGGQPGRRRGRGGGRAA